MKALSFARSTSLNRAQLRPLRPALEFIVTNPISPPPVNGGGRNELPAYVANGVMGLRIRAMPLAAGLTLLSGYSGEHPQRRIEAIAVAPYPIASDIQIGEIGRASCRERV